MNARFRILIATLVTLAVAATPLWAQSNVGEVQIYVFSQVGLPLEGVEARTEDGVYVSNDSGLINFVFAPGTHQFELYRDDVLVGRVELPVRQGEVTEVIVTASPQNAQTVQSTDVESEREAAAAGDRSELDTDAPTGRIVGTVVDIQDGEPVPNATVIFRGVNFETVTDDDGRFVAAVPAGEYSFSVIHPDFSTRTQDSVEVVVDTDTELAVELTPSAIQLDEVMVFAAEEVIVQGGIANLIEETRNSAAVLNLIGSEQIDRSGDGDAAGALARVTGLSVVDGRFVYIRGMGERYSSSLLNGARLPSPEPDKRVVPLNLFPTSVVESIAVQKSYSPELAADFGGGAISIRSAGIPDDRYQRRLRVGVSAGLGINVGTTFEELYVEQRGLSRFTGIDDGARRLPDELAETEYAKLGEGGSPIFGGGLLQSDVDQLGQAMPNTWTPRRVTVPVDFGGGVSVRDKIELRTGGSVGFNVAMLYSNGWGSGGGDQNTYQRGTGGPSAVATYRLAENSNEVDLGTLIDIAVEPQPGISIEAVSLLVRTSESSYLDLSGLTIDLPGDVRQITQLWTEDMLFSQRIGMQLATDNGSDILLDYTLSLAQRYQPDGRYALFIEEGQGFQENNEYDPNAAYLSDRLKGQNQRVWSTVLDVVHDLGASIELPVTLRGRSAPDYLDLGLYGMLQNRSTDLRRFAFQPNDVLNDPGYDFGSVLNPEGIGDEITFEEITYPADNYSANHLIAAAYGVFDLLVVGDVRANFGVRAEYSRQYLQTYTFPNPVLEEPILQTIDVLPAINISVPILDRSQFRVSASRTINRPDLRELSAAPFFGPPGFGTLVGNPDLQRASIVNLDGRFESYFSLTESFSLGGFAKFFTNAIEVAQLNDAAYTKVPVNTASALNLGAELEWAIQLRFLSDGVRNAIRALNFASAERERRWRRALGGVASILRDIRTTGNIALIQSSIDYGADGFDLTYNDTAIINTSTERPLQGQAPYVINAAIGYRNEVSFSQLRPVHTSLFLNFNVIGPSIRTLGVDGVPDQYQQPFGGLDLIVRQELGFIPSISIELGNLLDPELVTTLGNESGADVVESRRRGRTVSISVSLDL